MVSAILVVIIATISIVSIGGITQRDNIQNFIDANTQTKQEIPEQEKAMAVDESAKYYAQPPVNYTCELTNNSNLRCAFEDGSSSVQQISSSDVGLVQNRLSYCNEIMQHRSATLDREPMLRCLFDIQEE